MPLTTNDQHVRSPARRNRRRPSSTKIVVAVRRAVVAVAAAAAAAHRILLVVLFFGAALHAVAEEVDNSQYDEVTSGHGAAGEDDDGADDASYDWVSVAVSALGLVPLAGIVMVLFVANYVVIPDLCTRALMNSYKTEGIVAEGTVLSCRTVQKSPRRWSRWWIALLGGSSVPRKVAKDATLLDDDGPEAATTTTISSQSYAAEIMYETVEHKYMDNPSLKFRHPEAYETKRFVRTFEFDSLQYDGNEDNPSPPLQRGDHVPVLLLRGLNHTRSGCPQPVVDRIYDSFSFTKIAIVLVAATIALGILVTIAIRNASRRLEDPREGWAVLGVVVIVSYGLGLLMAVDRFLKMKRRRFDSATPMVSSADQREVLEAKRRMEHQHEQGEGRDNPFRIPLHEFAGHARASERHRFD